MESAIPEHLKQPRTRARSTPAQHQPSFPAWVGRYEALVDQVVMAYFGVQSRDKVGDAPLLALAARFSASNGPGHWERAHFVDAQGYDTVITVAYWASPAAFAVWRGESGFDAWWRDPARRQESCGYFLEVLTPTADRFETLQSSPDRPEGIARLQHHVSEEIEEHAYWGGARDRIALSQTDPLDGGAPPALEPKREALGARVVIPGRENLCLIRSGQDWADTAGDERSLYLEDIQPTLVAGMSFLRDEGREIGCLSCRFVTVLDEQGRRTEKTFGLAHFDSLASLERWARTHPTHLAIFGGFQRYVKALNFAVALRLYHEVTVVPAGGQYFEYVNCHPGTGLFSR